MWVGVNSSNIAMYCTGRTVEEENSGEMLHTLYQIIIPSITFFVGPTSGPTKI